MFIDSIESKSFVSECRVHELVGGSCCKHGDSEMAMTDGVHENHDLVLTDNLEYGLVTRAQETYVINASRSANSFGPLKLLYMWGGNY